MFGFGKKPETPAYVPSHLNYGWSYSLLRREIKDLIEGHEKRQSGHTAGWKCDCGDDKTTITFAGDENRYGFRAEFWVKTEKWTGAETGGAWVCTKLVSKEIYSDDRNYTSSFGTCVRRFSLERIEPDFENIPRADFERKIDRAISELVDLSEFKPKRKAGGIWERKNSVINWPETWERKA